MNAKALISKLFGDLIVPNGGQAWVETIVSQNSVVCMRAQNLSATNIGFEVSDRDMAEPCFPTQNIADQYQGFIDTFSSIDKTWLDENSVDKSELASPELVALRLILVDHYRRIVLHDPHLPSELLPKQWIGERAYHVFKESYQLLYSATEDIYHKRVSAGGASLRVATNNRKPSRFAD